MTLGMVTDSETGPSTTGVGTRSTVTTRLSDGFTQTSHGQGAVTYPVTTSRWQHGYRSGPLSEEEKASIGAIKPRWGNVMSQLDALERIQRATSSSPLCRTDPFVVNEREYRELKVTPASYSHTASWTDRASNPRYEYDVSGTCTFGYVNPPQSSLFPKPPSLDGARVSAAGLMRNHRPTRPDMDLTQFIGELRDVNGILKYAQPKISTEIADRSLQHTPTGYLQLEFGVRPTVSDLQSLADAIVKGDALTKRFIRDSSRLIHRSSMRVVDSGQSSRNIWVRSQGSGSAAALFGASIGGWGFSPVASGNGWGAFGVETVQWTTYIKAFNTFEYYVGDPYQATTRMDSYASKARKLLGGGLTLSSAYELTRFSWMLDWFVDIGGLLAYQQDVADYSLVSRRAGFTISQHIGASLGLSVQRYPTDTPRPNGHATSTAGVASWTYRWEHRYPSSPYAIGANWGGLNPRQWAILGALGMTKAPRVPNTR